MKRIVFPGIAMIGVSYAFARFSFGMFLPDVAEDLRITDAAAGAVGSLAYAAYCLALLTSALLIHRFGAYAVLLSAGVSAVLGMAGIALAPDVTLLAVAVFVAGLSSGWASPALSEVVSGTLKPGERDRGNTWVNSGTSFGLVFSGPVVLLLTEHWRLSYGLFAVLGIAVLLWNGKAVPGDRHGFERKSGSGLKLPGIWMKSGGLIAASLLTGASSAVYWTFSRSYLTAEYGMSYRESVIFWVLMGSAGIVGGLAGGVVQRLGLAAAYRITLLILVLSIAAITIPFVPAVYASGLMFGGAYIVMTGLFIVWGTRLFVHNPAVAVSLSFLMLGIGQSLGAAIAGGLIERASYTVAFVCFAGIGLIGLLVPINAILEAPDGTISPICRKDRRGFK